MELDVGLVMVTVGAVVSPVDGVGVGVGVAEVENQLVLLPLSVEFVGLIMALLILLESFTSTNDIFFVPVGSTFH